MRRVDRGGECADALRRLDPVYPATVLSIPGTGSKPERTVGDRASDRRPGLVGRSPAVGGAYLRTSVGAVVLEAGLIADEAHGTAFGAGAEQGPLRAAQNLDPIQVEDLRRSAVGADVHVVGAAQHRRVIQIDGRGRCAGAGLDTADLDIAQRRAEAVLQREIQSGRDGRNVADAAHAAGVHILLSEGADTDRDFVDIDGGLLRGRDRDLSEAALGRDRRGRLGSDGIQCQDGGG